MRDIGSARETAERLVAAEEQRKASNPFNKVTPKKVRDAYERVGPGGLVYYTAEYTKTVVGVERVIATVLVVADGTLYTLTAEEDKGRFESEMGEALRRAPGRSWWSPRARPRRSRRLPRRRRPPRRGDATEITFTANTSLKPNHERCVNVRKYFHFPQSRVFRDCSTVHQDFKINWRRTVSAL